MNSEEWAYIAGFFDGEGWISVAAIRGGSGRESFAIRIGLVQKKPEVLLWIRSKLGFGYLDIQYGSGIYERNKATQLMFGKQAEQLEFLIGVLPYLHVKRNKAELAIAFLQLKQQWNGKHMGRQRKPLAQVEAEKVAYARMMTAE